MEQCPILTLGLNGQCGSDGKIVNVYIFAMNSVLDYKKNAAEQKYTLEKKKKKKVMEYKNNSF